MVPFLRAAITANGGTPTTYSVVGALRALVTAYGGTPTQFSVTGLLREAVTAAGGSPTKYSEVYLLRELLTALGATATSFDLRALYLQLSTTVKSGGAAFTIPTPTLTETTSPAGSALTFNIGVTGYPVGLYWNLQVASDAAFTTALSGEGAIRDEIRIVTVSDLTDDDLDGVVEADPFTAMAALPNGATYARIRLGRESDDGLSFTWGSWSNTVNETIASAASVPWDATNKSGYITLSNTDLTATSADTGSPSMVLGSIGKASGLWYFEVHVTVGANFNDDLVGLSTASRPADFSAPGSASTTAISYRNNGLVYLNNGNDGGGHQATYDTAATYVIGVAFNMTTKKVWFAKANTYYGDPAAGTLGHSISGIATAYPMVGLSRPTDFATIKSTLATMTYAPPTGFTALGGG